MSTATAQIERLLVPVPALTPEQALGEVADLFLSEQYSRLLSLPVVSSGRPIGLISRYQVMKLFLKRYGRELYGRRPVTAVMNSVPLMVAHDLDIASAAQFITANIPYPITEDFIIVDDGRYRGLGVVLDLLRAMEERTARDAAELENAYRRLKDSQLQLVQSEKMASLGQMVAGVAHEINTPLGYVRNNVAVGKQVLQQACDLLDAAEGMIDSMMDSTVAEDVVATKLDVLRGVVGDLRESSALSDAQALTEDNLFGLDQISELVINLRSFSRLDQAKISDVDLNACLDSVLVIARNVLKHRVEVIREYSDLPPVRCVPSQINQVLMNIITNAAQAIEGEGQIVIKTSADDGFVLVVIQDNGRGMSPDVMKRVFDPFFTTKPVGQGTGLGLSICYQIVQQHQGQIQVMSVPGKGSQFVISLPRQSAALDEESSVVLAESA